MQLRRSISVSAAALSAGLLLTCAISAGLATIRQASPAAATVRLDAHRSLGTARQFRNLTLIPVYDSAARATDTYMTLDEGLKAKVVKVKESPGGGEVNTL